MKNPEEFRFHLFTPNEKDSLSSAEVFFGVITIFCTVRLLTSERITSDKSARIRQYRQRIFMLTKVKAVFLNIYLNTFASFSCI